MGEAALHQAHEIADRKLRRHRHEHMDIMRREHAPNDLDARLAANLPADAPDAQPDVALKHLVSILRRPDDVVAVIENQWLPVSYCMSGSR